MARCGLGDFGRCLAIDKATFRDERGLSNSAKGYITRLHCFFAPAPQKFGVSVWTALRLCSGRAPVMNFTRSVLTGYKNSLLYMSLQPLTQERVRSVLIHLDPF